MADSRIEDTIGYFSRIYLGGIPPIITNDSAYLSFLCVLAATDALAGYRYADTIGKDGERFETFVENYYPADYVQHAHRLWILRCRMMHAFSPAGFALIHHQSDVHFATHQGTGNPILNAEDFYAAMVFAAQKYFAEVRSVAEVQALMIKRMEDRDRGGTIGVGPAGSVRVGAATTQP